MQENAPPPSPALAHTLAEAPLPLRVRQILESLMDMLAQTLRPQLDLTVVELERVLFKRADTARSSQHQSEILAELRQLRELRAQLPTRILAGIEASLAALHGQRGTIEPATRQEAEGALSLVTGADIDRDIVMRDIARREAYRGRSALQLLAHRFAVLAASPLPDDEDTPLGPYALCRIVADVGTDLPFTLDTQLGLLRAFGQQVMATYPNLSERINLHLEREGVLPGLVYTPYRARPAGQSRRTRSAASEDVPASPSAALRDRHAPMTRWTGQAATTPSWGSLLSENLGPDGGSIASGHAAAPAASGVGTTGIDSVGEPPAMSELRAMLGRVHQGAATGLAGMPAVGTHATAAAGSGPSGTAHAVPSSAPAPTPAAPMIALPTGDVLDTLAQLQADVKAAPRDKPAQSLHEIRRTLLRRTREKHGENAMLSPQDQDTFDLLDLLYGEIRREVRPEAPAADLLARLQVPLVRAALQDRGFFVREQHPARELLNSVAESGATWLADDETDPQLLARLRQAVDRVLDAYDGNDAVFEEANQDIQNQYRALARKAETTERRHVEAARGKDRLDSAKQHAAQLIRASLAKRNPPRFQRALIEQAWSDVLTLTLLRQGTQSEEWKERTEITRRIAALSDAGDEAPADPQLAGKVESALLQIGYHQDEAGAIARHLSHTQGEEAAPSRTELTARLKARMKPGGEAPAAHKPEPPPRTPEEEACHAQLRTLPFGTWFEFVRNQQGDVQRQRLSWFSLTTGNALFVNQRGQKVGETTLDELSRLMARDQARIVTEDQGRLIDRAWQATLKALRNLAGMGAADVAAAGSQRT